MELFVQEYGRSGDTYGVWGIDAKSLWIANGGALKWNGDRWIQQSIPSPKVRYSIYAVWGNRRQQHLGHCHR